MAGHLPRPSVVRIGVITLPVAALRPAFVPLAVALARRHRLDARDLEQDVWLRVVERAAGGTLPRDLTSWLRALTLQECRMATRTVPAAPLTRTALPGQVAAPPTVPSAEDQVLAAHRRRAVRQALAGLPGRCPELLATLAELPELTYRQVAERLGIPRGSIGPTRSRCLGCLRSLLHGQAQGRAAE